jgi:DNA-binding SARP family transcriptional activator
MKFRIFGPLTVEVDEHRKLSVPASRQRTVLATLVLNANRVVSVDQIAEFVWDGVIPPSSTATVRTYVMRLRGLLGPTCAARLVTRSPGYLIELDSDESDIGQFTAHRTRATALARAGDLPEAAEELRAALALWRDDPLMDVSSTMLRDVEIPHLKELRMQTSEWLIDLDLQLGRHTELIPELFKMVRIEPLRESFAARLMTALSRSGRRFEALEVFRQTRKHLIDQLGIEPGEELRKIQHLVLNAKDDARVP